jgi:hypothetical protein
MRASSISAPPWLLRLLSAFAVVAAVLWILPVTPMLTGHPFAFTALFPGGRAFADILVYHARFTLFHTRKFFLVTRGISAFAYPAGAAPVYEVFNSFAHPDIAYLDVAAAWTAIFTAITWAILAKASSAGTATRLYMRLALLSFPLIFLIERANIELILWMIVAIGILAYRKGYAVPAAILFGVAASMKLYPIFLLGLFLKRRRDLPAFAIGIVTALAATAFAIAYAGPTFSIAAHGFYVGVDRFQDHYAETVRSAEIDFDHSLFSPIKYWSYVQHQSLQAWMTPYYLCAGAFAGLLYLRVRTLPFLNRVIFLVAAMVSLPPVSYSYTLIHLFLPVVLFVAALLKTRNAPTTAKLAFAAMLFMLLPLVALSAWQDIPAGPIQSLGLLFLLPLAAISPWEDTTSRLSDL